MAIIDNKSKYVWEYYLQTKDQAYDEIKEWLENEIGLLRGRDNSRVRCGQATNERLHTGGQCICGALVSYQCGNVYVPDATI